MAFNTATTIAKKNIQGTADNITSRPHYPGMNFSIKLDEMLIDAFMLFFSFHGRFEASFYEITLARGLYEIRKGDKSCNFAVASRNLLHSKPELTPNYRKSILTSDGCWSITRCSISSPNLSVIHPIFSEKIDPEMMIIAFSKSAKFGYQRNAKHYLPLTHSVVCLRQYQTKKGGPSSMHREIRRHEITKGCNQLGSVMRNNQHILKKRLRHFVITYVFHNRYRSTLS